MDAFIGNREYFPGIGKIKFEGRESKNPLAFKWYDEKQMIGGKTMKDHLRFAIAYWHTFCGEGGDPFGPGTKSFPWNGASDPIEAAKNKLDAAIIKIKSAIPGAAGNSAQQPLCDAALNVGTAQS